MALADAVTEINGLFVESKVPLRSRLLSVFANPAAGGIHEVGELVTWLTGFIMLINNQ